MFYDLEFIDDLMFKDEECIQEWMEAILILHKRLYDEYGESLDFDDLEKLAHIALSSFYDWQVD